MLLSEVLWTIHIFPWAAGGQIPWCIMLLSLVWRRVYEQNLSEWANGFHSLILIEWHWSGQCEVHRVRFSWTYHCGRSSDAFQRWYKRAGPYTRTQNTGTPRTYEHRQLKSHGNSLNCQEKSWKSHGIVLSYFCGNPVIYGTNKNDINHSHFENI